MENLKRYREKMDKYRSSLNIIHSDNKVYFLALNIIDLLFIKSEKETSGYYQKVFEKK